MASKITIDCRLRDAVIDGDYLLLTPTEFALLCVMHDGYIRTAGEIDERLQTAYGMEGVAPKWHFRNMRKKGIKIANRPASGYWLPYDEIEVIERVRA